MVGVAIAMGILIMKSIINIMFAIGLTFLKNTWGSLNQPYATYRNLVKQNLWQLVPIWIIVGMYFLWISPIRLHTLHPLVLTANAGRLFFAALGSYFLVCLWLTILGKLFHGQINLLGIFLGMGYSLLPTLVWFLTNSIFFVILPPPRQPSVLGAIFTIFFLTISIALFFWKGILYYLTLRFAMRLDLRRIIGVTLIFLPTLFLFSVWLYRLKAFRVPFI